MNCIDKSAHAIMRTLLKEKLFPPVALSESVYNLVHTINNDLVSIRSLNGHDSEAIQPILPHRIPKVGLQAPESAE